MAELLLSSTSEKPQIEKLGLGLLIADTTSHDPITPTGPSSEIQHTEPLQDEHDGISNNPPAAVMAAEVVEESGATDEEAEFQIALEREFCRLTIEQAEIEHALQGSEAADVEEGKDVEGTDVVEEKDVENAEIFEDENPNGLGAVENDGAVKPDPHLENKNVGEIAESAENENGGGIAESAEIEKGVEISESAEIENGGEIAERAENKIETRWGYLENEETMEPDYVDEEKGGKNIESVENENRWGYIENEGSVKQDYVHEERGKNIESLENEIEDRWGYIQNEGSMKQDNVYDEKGGENSESVDHFIENGLGYMENAGGYGEYAGGYGENEESVGGKSWDAARFGRFNNQSNNNKRISYPMRPDAEDCAFYMKSGSCKFGSNCKFNHPPRRKNQGVQERGSFNEENPERAGQTECKYYLTSGGCKYGMDCRFSHGSDKSSKSSFSVDFNFLGLPIRQGEKECPYFMRTGTCKFGTSCRFNHPEPTTMGGADSSSGYGNDGSIPSQLVSSSSVSSWSSPRAFNETSSFTPGLFSQTHGAPTSNSDWNSYQAATYPTSEKSLPTPPAFALHKLPTEINFPMQHQLGMGFEEYPERPGEPECGFFMKTGDCKFKSNCKFHHPSTRRNPKPRANFTLSDKGLPFRPDQPICTHYHRYGICKFGPACKYNHPPNYGNVPTSSDGLPFRNSKVFGGES